MNDLRLFSFEGNYVRTILRDDEYWFVAKDVAERLEYKWQYNLVNHVPEEWKGVIPINTPGGEQNIICLKEEGLYFFVARSDKPKALPFQKWLAGDVLPKLRQNGRYEISHIEHNLPSYPDALRQLADSLEREKEQRLQLESAKPKIEFFDTVAESKDAIEVGLAAKTLKLPFGRNKLFQILREKKILMSGNVPYQKHIDAGYFTVIELAWQSNDGKTHVTPKTLVTQKGLQYIKRTIE